LATTKPISSSIGR